MGNEPERTTDGRYLVVKGRRWRATDPSIPETLRQELVNELMRSRRAVKTHGDDARPMVNDAKIALGERGDPWWEPTPEGQRARLAATMRALLRGRNGTICPSDAARVVGGKNWRSLMDVTRDVAVELCREGVVKIRQNDNSTECELPGGPIRIGPGAGLQR